jgi:branched-chain amino acid aminotransferase
MRPQAEATKTGYSQVLWLFGEDETITEVGAIFIFFFLVNKGTKQREACYATTNKR